jgi:hypothetical protein
MSFVDVREYFSEIAGTLGFSKHYDGFATDNIPSTRFDKSYHVTAFAFDGSAQNQTVVDVSAPVTIRLYFKGFRDVDAGISLATQSGLTYLRSCLASENRLSQTNVKNVVFDGMTVEPYAATNDNYIVCVLNFRAYLYLQIC